MLPEFAHGRALPAAAGFGPLFGRGQGVGEVLADVGGDRGTGAVEVETAGQFVGQEREGGRGPAGMMIAAGGLEGEGVFVGEPLMAQFVEPGAAEHQALGGSGGIELAGVEGGQDWLDVEGLDTVSELFLFIGARR